MWPEKDEELLVKLATEEKLTWGEIAKRLNRSRNSCIGKANRMGLTEKKKPSLRHEKLLAKKSNKKTIPTKTNKKPVHSRKLKDTLNERLFIDKDRAVKTKLPHKRFRVRLDKELERTKTSLEENDIINIPYSYECKWITGDVKSGKATWCRKLVSGKKNYCLKHKKIVYKENSTYLDWKSKKLREKNK